MRVVAAYRCDPYGKSKNGAQSDQMESVRRCSNGRSIRSKTKFGVSELVISVDVLKERRAATVLVHSPTIQVIPGIITVIKNNRVRGESSNSPDDI